MLHVIKGRKWQMAVRYMETLCTIITNTKFRGSLLCACSATKLCPTVCDPMDCSLPSCSLSWDFPGMNTGVGCHFLLQGVKTIIG